MGMTDVTIPAAQSDCPAFIRTGAAIVIETRVSELDELLEVWPDLSDEERLKIFEELGREKAEDLFLELTSRQQCELVLQMSQGERRMWLRLLPPDDAADLIQAAPPETRDSLLQQLDPVATREVTALLAYKEDVAGGLMSPRFVRLRPDMTVDAAISYLRRQAT